MIDIEAKAICDVYHVKAMGHANYAPEGQDVVCAGVSALLDSLAVYVHRSDQVRDVEDQHADGWYYLVWRGTEASGQAYKLTMLGLMCIARQFPEHVRVMCSLGGL